MTWLAVQIPQRAHPLEPPWQLWMETLVPVGTSEPPLSQSSKSFAFHLQVEGLAQACSARVQGRASAIEAHVCSALAVAVLRPAVACSHRCGLAAGNTSACGCSR